MGETYATNRWSATVVGAFLLAGLGTVLQSPLVLASATVPLVFLGYARLTAPPSRAPVLERSFDDPDPVPGQEVTVTVTVRNPTDRLMPDVRVVDAVPDELGVVEGSPRYGTAVPAGESRSFTYTVVARQGRYEFDGATVLAYDASGARATRSEPAVDSTLECVIPVEEVPLGEETARNVGRLSADTGGAGVEFYGVREYRPSDPRSRVDWRRFAKADELTTIQFREERAATVLVLVDDREAARSVVDPRRPTGAEYCAYAAELTFRALARGGNRVGLGFYPDDVGALPVGAGPEQRVRARQLFRYHDEHRTGGTSGGMGAGARADGAGFDVDEFVEGADGPAGGSSGAGAGDTPDGDPLERLLASLPSHAQVLFLTPLYDDHPVELVRRMRAHDVEVSVISPAAARSSSDLSVGARTARIERRLRVDTLLGEATTVVDWSTDEPLQLLLDRITTEVG